MQEYLKSENHPFVALIYLILLALGGAVVFGILGFVFSALLFGFPHDILNEGFMAGEDDVSLGYLKVIQIFTSAGMFLAPPLVFARIESKKPFNYLKLDNPVPSALLILSVLIMVSAMPVLQLTVEVNQAMKLPGFLKGLEEWMLAKERELEVMTKKFLVMKDLSDLALNMFMIAVLPAISEELMFRGAIQRIFTRWTKNYHLGIWLAAIIFSAIHVQFYGFLPRMLLGALFGYLLVWSNTIWIPILAHFLNNGLTVIAAYVYQQKGMPIDEVAETGISGGPLVYVVGTILLSAFLLLFYKRSKLLKGYEQRLG
ncbi:MAG TPA: CPBP family intramembrane glutamic endopeptidase [Sphingobacteriaceae bacterium]